MENKNDATRNVCLLIAGGLIGAGIALLLAPQSGRKTRRDLRHLGRVAMNKTEAVRLDLQHAIDNAANAISERLSEEIDRGLEWTDNTRRQFIQALESGKNYIRQEVEKITRA